MSAAKFLGMVESLEAMLIDGKKIPLTDLVMVDEKKALLMIERLKAELKSWSPEDASQSAPAPEPIAEAQTDIDIDALIKQADKIKLDANQYADNVLAKLVLLVTKLQKNLVGMERTLENGRNMIQKGDNS